MRGYSREGTVHELGYYLPPQSSVLPGRRLYEHPVAVIICMLVDTAESESQEVVRSRTTNCIYSGRKVDRKARCARRSGRARKISLLRELELLLNHYQLLLYCLRVLVPGYLIFRASRAVLSSSRAMLRLLVRKERHICSLLRREN